MSKQSSNNYNFQCTSAMECFLNGDCVDGVCVCDPAWSGSADCSVMKFLPVNKSNRPGYYNATSASWGGIPVKGPDGRFHLIHAQVDNYRHHAHNFPCRHPIMHHVHTTHYTPLFGIDFHTGVICSLPWSLPLLGSFAIGDGLRIPAQWHDDMCGLTLTSFALNLPSIARRSHTDGQPLPTRRLDHRFCGCALDVRRPSWSVHV